jgi:trigger factor
MQITTKNSSPTKIELTIAADKAQMEATKNRVVADLAKTVNLAGFRKGHAPLALVEKNVDPATLQSQFLDHVINDLYVEAITQEKLRPVATPEVTVTKFVPFDTLEFTATVEVVGKITLGDYKKVTVVKKEEKVTAADVTAVIDDLRARDGKKEEVKRAAKDSDEVTIDFAGVDATTKEPLEGGKGDNYPLIIGSNTFIPGFEPELIGLKAGDEKTFDITFPKDYGAKELQNKKVTFTVTVQLVKEVKLPELSDEFATAAGPFKTVAELKADIKKQLQSEKDAQAKRAFESDLLEAVAKTATADIPKALIEEEIDRMEEEEKRNLVYRGQTWQEHLESEGKTDEQHREGLRESAETRVKTGLVLGEVAEAEKITVDEKELTARIAELKKQYTDKQMQSELDKPENQRELRSRLLTEKTIERLAGFVK